MEEIRKKPLPAGEDGRRVWSSPTITKAEISVVTQNSAFSNRFVGDGGGNGVPDAFYAS